LICQFIDDHKDRFGVVPICRALSQHGVPIAPRTYWARRSRAPSRRSLRDEALTEILAAIYEPDEHGRRQPESLYGSELAALSGQIAWATCPPVCVPSPARSGIGKCRQCGPVIHKRRLSRDPANRERVWIIQAA
jgi:hypothetical protein